MTHTEKAIWTEDDATPETEGHITLAMKWREMFGEELDTSKATAKHDLGDTFVFEMPNGYTAINSYCGGEIRKTIHKEQQ